MQGLYVPAFSFTFRFKFIDSALEFPHIARESGELLLSIVRKLNAIAHVSQCAMISTLRV
ncbi:MAG: hypothetical protein DMG57_15875 [Acidobacteria bacterium]|nr:MAG: hypothetical protein DMG57_15875 [Acidobacteriota bacterium]